MKLKRMFTGLQPTGLLHLGNYLGAIRNLVSLQDQYETFVCVVDLHAITTPYQPGELSKNTLHLISGLLACGVDPEKSHLFVQSHVPEHMELEWYLNCITPLGSLQRMTQFKDKKERVEVLSAGLLNYPILQAADILLYQADLVPVGEDQAQHLELARDIAQRFNTLFGPTFVEPQTLLPKKASRIMALNHPDKKMSKSLEGSFIALTDSDEEITKKLKRAVTDVGPAVQGEMSPGVRNLFTLLEAFSSEDVIKKFHDDFQNGSLRYSDLKAQIIEDLLKNLRPIRASIENWTEKPEAIEKIVWNAASVARSRAKETLEDVRKKMGFFPRC